MKLVRRLRMPSPAMAVALVALFVALGGSAYALTVTGADIVNGSITGADIRQRSLTGTKFELNSIGGNAIKASSLKPRTFSGNLFKLDSIGGNAIKESTLGPVPQATGSANQAVVNAAGQLVSGRGVAANGVAQTGVGTYQVTFDVPVGACAYAGMLADSNGGTPPLGQIAAATIAANPNALQIRTTNQAGVIADQPFHIILSC
jgi:hypothetical protein